MLNKTLRLGTILINGDNIFKIGSTTVEKNWEQIFNIRNKTFQNGNKTLKLEKKPLDWEQNVNIGYKTSYNDVVFVHILDFCFNMEQDTHWCH